MKISLNKTPRYLALDILVRVEKQKSYSNLALNSTLKKSNLNKRDANLVTKLVYGVIQRKITLKYWLTPFIKNKKVDLWVEQLLLLAIYQLQYLDKIPTHAIFDETIEIAKNLGHSGIRKFVTGVLHSIKRNSLSVLDKITPLEKKISIQTSTPLWLVNELIIQLGEDKTRKILSTINQAPKQSVRINIAKESLNNIKKDLAEEGFTVNQSNVTPLALNLTGKFVPESLAFKSGKIVVQDESAALPVESMEVKESDNVLDACAAPGGKTTQIASFLKNGKVLALDIHRHKVELIEKNAKRAGVSSQTLTQKMDARKLKECVKEETFDKILVDAPCSGLGLMRRKPEVKYEKTLNDSKNLHKVQLSILNSLAPLLKKKGRLTYSTCTILNQENQDVIDDFLKQNKNFRQIKTVTKNKLKFKRESLGLTIYPDDYLSDGFFIATLEKI